MCMYRNHTQVLLTDMANFAAVNAVYKTYFPDIGPLPARACYAVKALPLAYAAYRYHGTAVTLPLNP